MVDVIKIDEREDEMIIPITLLITELSLSTINTRLLPVSEIIRSPVCLSTIKRLGLLRFPARMAPLVPPIVDSIGFDEYAEIKLFLLASLLVAKAAATAALPATSVKLLEPSNANKILLPLFTSSVGHLFIPSLLHNLRSLSSKIVASDPPNDAELTSDSTVSKSNSQTYFGTSTLITFVPAVWSALANFVLNAETALMERTDEGRQNTMTEGSVPLRIDPLRIGKDCIISVGKSGKVDGDCNAFVTLFSSSWS